MRALARTRPRSPQTMPLSMSVWTLGEDGASDPPRGIMPSRSISDVQAAAAGQLDDQICDGPWIDSSAVNAKVSVCDAAARRRSNSVLKAA